MARSATSIETMAPELPDTDWAPGARRSLGGLLGAQCLGAVNDNAFKTVVMLYAVQHLSVDRNAVGYVALAGALFTLPYILFSGLAGRLADRFSRQRVLLWAKAAEVAIMGAGALTLHLGNVWAMLVVLSLMGAQSAFFSPSKYGIVPDLAPASELPRANGALQLWAFVGIILGTVLGGGLSLVFADRLYLSGVVLTGIALAGLAWATRIRPVAAAEPGSRRPVDRLGDIRRVVRALQRHPVLRLALCGSAFFWFVGALYQMTLVVHARRTMVLGELGSSVLMALVGLGIGLGSVVAGRWSRGRIELGMPAAGAAGLAVFSAALLVTVDSFAATGGLLFALGGCGAMFTIPFDTAIQRRSPAALRSRVIAAGNVLSNLCILGASLLFWLVAGRLGLGTGTVFAAGGTLALIAAMLLVKLLPEATFRFIGWLIVSSVYRIRARGLERIPARGGVLLVSNHVSYADALVLQAVVRRPIRFLVAREHYERRWIRPIARLVGAIPISDSDSPKRIVRSLRAASDALRRGEVVCIFPEGSLTRTGNLLPFRPGFERILRHARVPVVPMYVQGLWGSVFSFRGGRFFRWRELRIPFPVTVDAGKPLPGTSTAFQVREAVSELAADVWTRRANAGDAPVTHFLRSARRAPWRFCMADLSGRRLTRLGLAVRSVAFGRLLGRLTRGDTHVGVLVPTSVPAAVVNLALTIAGRVPVNLNYTASAEAMDRAIHSCGLRTIVTSRRLLEKRTLPVRPEMVFLEDLAGAPTRLDILLGVVLTLAPVRWLWKRVTGVRRPLATDPAAVLFSSGSSGNPKGIVLSHANIAANLAGARQVLGLRRDDVMVGILPFFHSFGFTGNLWLPLNAGVPVVYHYNPLEAHAVGRLVRQFRGSVIAATPTFLARYCRTCTREAFHTLRLVITGAEKLTPPASQAFQDKFGVAPLEGYGCTELSPMAAANVLDRRDGQVFHRGHRPGTVGHPLPGVAVRIVDPDTGNRLGPGQDGLLLVKAPSVMREYLGDPDRTRQALIDGWYVTGDLAHVDADGFLTIVDRLSRFSKIGGEMVPHLRVEDEIHEVLGAGAERVCAVTSLPDPDRGERLAVLYTGDIDVQGLCKRLRGAGLPSLWLPRPTAFFRVHALPLLGSGKLDVRGLRALAGRLAGGAAA